MAYNIDRYNNTPLTTIQDGTIDQTTDLKLVGKNYAGYGEIQNENFVFLLENFNGGNPPPKAVSGQIWFDNSNSKLKFYDGSQWRTTGGAEVSGTSPSGLALGDFWWDTNNEQLYALGSSGFVLIGPQDAGDGITQMQSKTVLDTSAVSRSIIVATINDEVIFAISGTEFTLSSESAITGFTDIRQGVTLKGSQSSNGVTSTADRFWGTAKSAEGLVIDGAFVTASDFVTTGSASFTNQTNFATDDGITVGVSADGRFKVENGQDVVLANDIGANLIFRAKDGATNKDVIELRPGQVLPGLSTRTPEAAQTVDLGTTALKFRNIYASGKLFGTAEKAEYLTVSGLGDVGGSISANAGTLAIRTSVDETINGQNITAGSLKANFFVGVGTQAQYADLAEKYSTQEELPAGTAVAVCGHPDHEIEPAKVSDICIGVVSTDPGLMMNSQADGQYIALKGRVPVRVKGPVTKGQPVYAWEDGVCSTIETTSMVGVALDSNDSEEEKLVECVLKV